MKKILILLFLLTAFLGGVIAQENTHKVKKTSTLPQKVHNVFSHKKHYTGYKSKREKHGIKRKHKVNYRKGKVVNKKSLS